MLIITSARLETLLNRLGKVGLAGVMRHHAIDLSGLLFVVCPNRQNLRYLRLALP